LRKKKKDELASSKHKIEKAASVIASFTFLSRILGLLRDVIIANIFGSGIVSDAFFVAFRIPNLLRRLFGEGSLTAAFVPVFSEHLSKDREDALRLANGFLSALSLILAAIAVTGVLLAPIIVRIQAYGFGTESYEYRLTVLLTRITFPYVFFICLVAFFMGVLNSFKHFAAPSAAPIFLNLSLIGSAFLISPHLNVPILGLAIGVLIGGFLQLILQIPWAIRYGVNVIPSLRNINHPGIKKIGILMIPAIFGAAVYQLNQFVSTFLASFLPRGSISWLYYADRLVQFPLGVFAISISTASLPSLSDHIAINEKEEFRKTLQRALNLTFFISIPSAIGLILLGEPIIMILFERGAFHHSDTINTSYALAFYAIGLCAFSAVRVLVNAFYAMKDTKTPVKIATISLLANFLFGIILMHPLKHAGLALALSLSSYLQFFMLLTYLMPILGKQILSLLLKDFLKFFFIASIMGVYIYFLKYLLPITTDMNLLTKILRLGILTAGGALLYIFLAIPFVLKSLKS